MSDDSHKAWSIDQLAKSEFFHQKLHQWGLLRVAHAVDNVQGENFDWNLDNLNISEIAWKKITHRGIKPVTIFAHPEVLTSLPGSTGYYRMLSMVSQKSMKRIGLDIDRYEQQNVLPIPAKAGQIAQTLNAIISNLIEKDERIDPREFDIWRGMAAGTQAQGSWQNTKGDRAEIVLKGLIRHHIEEKDWLIQDQEIETDPARTEQITLSDGRIIIFGDEPDIGIYQNERIIAAVEVKGGIDTAAVLERIGAAIKSLSRARNENRDAVTILIMQAVSMTAQARNDLESNRTAINHWFTIEDILDVTKQRNAFLNLIGL
jgi:hypothetical protein